MSAKAPSADESANEGAENLAESWKVTAFAPRAAVEAALEAYDLAPDFDPQIAVLGFEIDENHPERWRLDAYLPRRPTRADLGAIAALFDDLPTRARPKLMVEALPECDWVVASQRDLEPVHRGRFSVFTPENGAPTDSKEGAAGSIAFVVPASQAFGTGQHQTTAGCLAMLDAMKRRGVVARHIADIGTGTGLLAFAALRLWPGAYASASDIDPVCAEVVRENAARNRIALGERRGELAFYIADGVDDPRLLARAPFDLLIANILAGPLIEMAPDFADVCAPRGHLLLAGLLRSQEGALRRAYRAQGFRLAARLVDGDWSILWLRRRWHG